MKITRCRVNHLENPMGYCMENLTFGWNVTEAAGTKQRDCRVQIFSDSEAQNCLFDTGICKDENFIAFRVNFIPEPETRYWWKVTVWSDKDEEGESELQYFETDKGTRAWVGKWISCDSGQSRLPVFYKKFEVKKPVKKARLYVCGLGLYEASINGQKVGDEYLTPGCSAYDRWLQYQTYDVTENLRNGQGNGETTQELEILLGNGWYKGRFGFDNPDAEGFYGNDWKLIAECCLEYEDGTKEVLGTDETWSVRRSNIVFSNIYDGEIHNELIEQTEEELSYLTEEPEGKLTGRRGVPIKSHEQWNPVELIHTPAGETVFDMGQNFAGIFKLRIHEKKGTVIHLQFGEILQNGNFYRDNLRTAKAEFSYCTDGSEKLISPKFTFFGYRYVKVSGITEPNICDFTAMALYSQISEVGVVETGDPLVNKLISNTMWGLKSNFVDVPMDCPQRDERMGWTGDAQVFSPTACYLTDCYTFYSKYLHDLWQEQKKYGGRVPEVVPAFTHKKTSAVWGDAACIIPWNLYRFYGDKSILESQFESMKMWVEYISQVDRQGGWGKQFHYGDWLALDEKQDSGNQFFGATDEDYIAYIYYMFSAEIVSNSAKIIGRSEEEKVYGKLALGIREYIQEEYFTSNGRCCVDTQTALVLALKHKLSSNSAAIKVRLRELLAKSVNRLQTGFVGTPLLCPVLSEYGMQDLAFQLLLNQEYPGWLNEVKLGATTIWERWNSVESDGSIKPTGMNSLNHYSYGSVVEWIFAYVAGIRQKEGDTGFRKVYLAPETDWKLGCLNAKYHSVAGTYEVQWKILDNRHMEVRVKIPFGCEAELTLPESGGRTVHLLGGDFCEAYETERNLQRVYSVNDRLADILNDNAAGEVVKQMVPQFCDVPKSYYKYTVVELFERLGGPEGLTAELKMFLQIIDEKLLTNSNHNPYNLIEKTTNN